MDKFGEEFFDCDSAELAQRLLGTIYVTKTNCGGSA